MKKIIFSLSGLLLFWCLNGFAVEQKKVQNSSPSETVGIVDRVVGEAFIKKAGANEWTLLKNKTKLAKYDEIKTTAKATVKITLQKNQSVQVKPQSTVMVADLLAAQGKGNDSLKKKLSKNGNKGDLGETGVVGVRGKNAGDSKNDTKPGDLNWK
jgi:hypothetical protein